MSLNKNEKRKPSWVCRGFTTVYPYSCYIYQSFVSTYIEHKIWLPFRQSFTFVSTVRMTEKPRVRYITGSVSGNSLSVAFSLSHVFPEISWWYNYYCSKRKVQFWIGITYIQRHKGTRNGCKSFYLKRCTVSLK